MALRQTDNNLKIRCHDLLGLSKYRRLCVFCVFLYVSVAKNFKDAVPLVFGG